MKKITKITIPESKKSNDTPRKFCPKCKYSLGGNFCPSHGTLLFDSICPKCKTLAYLPLQRFCKNCGADLHEFYKINFGEICLDNPPK